MPRFSELEKTRIEENLMIEGTRLFCTYGLKKVTIDDIVKEVHIAKASFYKFYQGKEYLFLEIAQRQQKEVFQILQDILEKSLGKSDIDRVRIVFFRMFELMQRYPMLAGIDGETIEIIARKVDNKRLEEYARQGFDAVKTIEKHGIHFKYKSQIVSQLFHTLYKSWINLQDQTEEDRNQIINIMLEGILQQIL